jgi:esterase/lipase superfamily enzyme
MVALLGVRGLKYRHALPSVYNRCMETIRMKVRYRRSCSTLILITIVLIAACARSPVYLMPTPEVMRDERFDVFANNPYLKSVDEITTYFASTRKPTKPGNDKYFSRHPGGALVLGQVTLQIGEPGDAWRSIYSESVMPSEEDRVALKLTEARIDAAWDLEELDATVHIDRPSDALELESSPKPLRADVQAFFDRLNRDLDTSPTGVLTVFVHGANNSFYESVARGAQIQYFTGDTDVALTYAWPSAGSAWRYGYDLRRAAESAGEFAEFMKLMSLYSTAKHINVIGYSVGGRIVGRGLAQLGEELPKSFIDSLPESPRTMNQVYLAASDQALKEFADNYPNYAHLVDTMTVTVNPDDSVLGLARIVGGQVRLGGAGDGDNLKDMPEEERQRLIDLINGGKLDIVDMQINDIDGFEYSHGAWYENPWLSSDVLVALYLGLKPKDRGLESYVANDEVIAWYFPEGYLTTLKESLLELFE